VSQLVEALYPLPDVRRTPLSLLRWWETRRLFYNKVVGATGLGTLAGVSIVSALPPHPVPFGDPFGDPLLLIVGAVVYGVLANGCYSMGWLLELAARSLWGRRAPDVGPLLFRQGLIFSVGLTLFPLLLASMVWVIRIIATIAN
jgi:hypothetical protein